MPDKNSRLPRNVPGPFYVDDTCIDCDLCRTTVPGLFDRDPESGLSYVARQPATDAERRLALDAAEGCPTESIGSDG